MFFGRRRFKNRNSRKGKDVNNKLNVTLEELYNGKMKNVKFEKNVICDKCSGIGGKKGTAVRCKVCRATGLEVIMRQLGSGMVQQMQTTCRTCDGDKEVFNECDRCKTCNGKKVICEKKSLNVHIGKGMLNGQQIRFTREGHQEPGVEPGDIIIVLEEMPHDLFTRNKFDLKYTMKLDLVDSLCGFSRTITTLDNRTLLIKTKPGEVIKNLEYRTIDNEGMPKYTRPFEHGQLIIQFEVVLPENNFLPVDKLNSMKSILPPSRFLTTLDNLQDAEECVLHKYDLSMDRNRHQDRYNRYNQVFDSDDEGGLPGGTQRIQCTSN